MRDWLTRFTLKFRLMCLLGLLAFMTVALTVAGLNGMRSSNNDLDKMFNSVLLPLDTL
jgi:methyl-accepting chemotaxis protein